MLIDSDHHNSRRVAATTMAERKTTTSPSLTSNSNNNSSRPTNQVMGLLMLVISAGILLLFTGLTVTITVLGFIFFMPLILLTTPIWFPIVTLLLITFPLFLCLCGFGAALFWGMSWIYRKYYSLSHGGGSGSWMPGGRVEEYDGRRRRIAAVADQMTFIARDHGGGYVQSRVK